MFKKVLVAEDIDSINIGLGQVLNELGITEIHHTKYCDDAFLKIKKANIDNAPFDLLISDLSFKTDHREVTILSGEKLIEVIKKENPSIKIIAYSIDDRPFTIKNLFKNLNIDAFIHKGRKSIDQLKTAISAIAANDNTYISPELSYVLLDKTIYEIDSYDIQLLKQLSQGVPQDKMDICFQELGITPNSKSTIEKRISKLKDYFKAHNTVHLVAIAKDLGIT